MQLIGGLFTFLGRRGGWGVRASGTRALALAARRFRSLGAVVQVLACGVGLYVVADFIAYRCSISQVLDGSALIAVYLIFASFASAGWSVRALFDL